ncbi:MAG: acetyl-CoA acyltransferase 2 [Myxococcota bacterium]|jgi:acetyl-CoA acyltransferase 2
MPAANDVVFLEGARTPIGSFLGGLSRVSATQLGTIAAQGAITRADIDPAVIDAIYFGNVIQSSKDAAYIARHIGLDAGIPESTPALTVNRACGSGIEAVVQGAKSLMVGESRVVLAGGAENMSMTPYAMRGVRQGWKMIKSDVDDMLFSALFDPKAGCSIGETVEHLAAEEGITRAAADAAAVRGQQRAAAAIAVGIFAEEIVPVTVGRGRRQRTVSADESPRPDSTLATLSALPGLFAADGVITAGNSCGLNDAGAAILMTTTAQAAALGRTPIGRLVSWGTTGIAPRRMGMGPIAASQQALDHAGLTLADIDIIELNDSFTVQHLAIGQAMGLDDAKVNTNGGAIALGHPMGATGTRLILSALYTLRRTGARTALCTVCIGGGQGIAVVVSA